MSIRVSTSPLGRSGELVGVGEGSETGEISSAGGAAVGPIGPARRVCCRRNGAAGSGVGSPPCSEARATDNLMLPRYCGGQHLREIDLEEGIRIALDALHADRLAVLCGAGLSMASPSNLPSAAQLASEAKRKYDSTSGATRDPLPPGIEEQAEFFFQRDELGTIYLRTLIDAHTFAGPPNPCHTAVADLLLVHAIQTAVSTNVDTLIEAAGVSLLAKSASASKEGRSQR
jgi:hypothetical protein